MSISKDQVKAYLSALSPAELRELILELEDRWGIERLATNRGFVTMGADPSGVTMGEEPVADVVLISVAPAERKDAIRALRARFDVSLGRARELVDGCPSLLAYGLDWRDALALRDELIRAGLTVDYGATIAREHKVDTSWAPTLR